MVIIGLVTVWALVEAGLAIALAAHPAGRTSRPGILGGLLDCRV
jgi:hypothetical protein